jgi:hypothetical protein
MSIVVRDPLELLPYLTGAISTPKEELAARGTQQLDVRQRSIALGEPIPIVFCRRVSNNGGVWVSPGATEGRFENDNNNTLIVNYQLVLSEGDLPQIPLNDLYQSACKIGEYYQTYNRRAGTWLPGNFVSDLSSLIDVIQFSFDAPGTASPTWYNATKNQYGGWDYIYNGVKHYYPGSLSPGPAGPVLQTRNVTAETFTIQKAPVHCGTSGTYANLTTLSFEWEYPNGDDRWDRQIHAFVRDGMEVTRILDSTLGPSNNIIDLALYLISQSSRLPSDLVDTTAMTLAANFTNTNSFFYNGEFKESSNLEDWLQSIGPKFLLRLSDKQGKKGFRPLVPINNDYTIKTTAVSWVFTFTEDHVMPGGFQIEYIPLSERKPICALMLWRQQPDTDVGVVRTSEVRFNGEAIDGPFEQHDLSEFCTTENHAIKVGAYYVARRKYITHSLRIRVKPDTYGGTLVIGDLVRVRLLRETEPDVATYHDYIYEVERITKSISGTAELDLMHFPVDDQNRSLVALAVAEATGAGYLLPTGRADFSCNLNTSSTPLSDVGGNLPGLPGAGSFDSDITAGNEGTPTGDLGNAGYPAVTGQLSNEVAEGETITASGVCSGAYVQWYRCPKGTDPANASLVCEEVSAGTEAFTYTLTSNDIDHEIVGVGRCPDPSTPDGLGEAFVIGKSEPIEPDILSYGYVRWVGNLIYEGIATSYTSSWTNLSGFSSSDYLTIGALSDCSFITNVGFIAPGADSRFSDVPVIGPIAWRAEVSVTTSGNGPLVGQVALGGLGLNGNAFNTCAVIGPSVKFTVYSSSPKTYSVSGTWEFSNDQSTVLRTWQGRDS